MVGSYYFAAIISLGFVIVHTFSMIVAFNGFTDGRKVDQVMVPAIHILAAVPVRIQSDENFDVINYLYFFSIEVIKMAHFPISSV